MSIKEKIDHIRDRTAHLAKLLTAAAVVTSSGFVSSCAKESQNTDENKDKIENVEEKTSVVFRAEENSSKYSSSTNLLMENGDKFSVLEERGVGGEGVVFLNEGDTVTYKIDKEKINGYGLPQGTIEGIRYKGTPEVKKKVDFGKIGKDITR